MTTGHLTVDRSPIPITRSNAVERGLAGPGRGWRAKERDVNASRGPNFLGQLVARARGPCDPPKSWIRRRGSVVVAPVTSIPTEALQSRRPMPKNRHACVRACARQELSLSRAFSSRYEKRMTGTVLRERWSRESFSKFSPVSIEENRNFDRKIDGYVKFFFFFFVKLW